MSRQAIKRKLKSVRRTNLQIQAYSEELERLRSIAGKCTPSYSASPGGGGFSSDKLPNIVAKCLEVEDLLKQEIAKNSEAFLEVHDLIQSVEQEDLRTLLNKRYLNFEKWEKIADDMVFSLQHIYHLHGQAIDYLADMDKDKSK